MSTTNHAVARSTFGFLASYGIPLKEVLNVEALSATHADITFADMADVTLQFLQTAYVTGSCVGYEIMQFVNGRRNLLVGESLYLVFLRDRPARLLIHKQVDARISHHADR